MSNPMIRIHDVATGEIIDREMTPAELKDFNESALELEATQAKLAKAEADKATAQAKLAALGLTADDLKALGL